MPTVRGSSLVRELATIPCADGPLGQRGRFRRDAIDLVERENLLNAAYCYRIVALDEPPSNVLRAGGETLDAMRLVPESGQLTAVAVGICTLGPALERRATGLFAERRMSLALALDKLGNELLFALSRRVQDRIVVEARKARLTAAGELRAGDPGLPLEAQAAVQRLAGAESIGVSVTHGQVMHPLKSMSMVLGIGIDLPPARWSRCDDCPSAPKCRMSGRADVRATA
jgi:Vitamin B12 dependent methionine synthase, activation domain.